MTVKHLQKVLYYMFIILIKMEFIKIGETKPDGGEDMVIIEDG